MRTRSAHAGNGKTQRSGTLIGTPGGKYTRFASVLQSGGAKVLLAKVVSKAKSTRSLRKIMQPLQHDPACMQTPRSPAWNAESLGSHDVGIYELRPSDP